MSDSASSKPSPDRLNLREIEQRLTAELGAAREQVRAASSDDERAKAQKAFDRALQRFTNFVTKGILP